MAKYIVFYEQSGGCDYTIGCGKELSNVFEAEDLSGAKDFVRDWISSWDEHTLNSLEQITIYELLESYVLTVQPIIEEIFAKKAVSRTKLIADKEREEYNRLKKKYE